ncbi:unnamed protein product [Paramecium pentaurelia]|uniref:Uncharacterized protein n=1 Tax=Paramecium pentaurelia TaxID=43138 RepID=A0A8S1TKX1_9CILI|nr:unnamed protein product [Paramecium pentaurelia]
MLGMQYHSYQYYSYIDIQKLKKILEWDKIDNVTLYEDEKTIKYKIDRSKHIRLSDLIELIEIGFIRFHLGQLLLFFQNLLMKVKLMEDQNLEHNYLREDRIWLNLQEQTQLSITYQKIKYSISFTGYQCQFYENLEEQVVADQQKILQIISLIIKRLKKNNIFLNKHGKSNNQIIDYIYEPILQSCQKGQIGDTINQLNILLTTYSYNSNDQTVSFDDRLIDEFMYSKRKHQKNKIEMQLQQLIAKLDQIPLVTELFMFEKIKEIRLNLKNWESLQFNDNDEILKYHQMLQTYNKNKNQFLQPAIALITGMLDDIVKNKIDIIFKESMQQAEKEQIINTIIGFKLLNYFENTNDIFLTIEPQFYMKLIIDLAYKYIEDYIDDYIKSEILILVYDLI